MLDTLIEFTLEYIFPILFVIGILILLICIFYILKYLLWDKLCNILNIKQRKISYGKVVGKELENNSRIENVLVGKNLLTQVKSSTCYIIKVEFKGLIFDCDCYSLYDDVEIGDKVIVTYMEDKNYIGSLELIEIIE